MLHALANNGTLGVGRGSRVSKNDEIMVLGKYKNKQTMLPEITVFGLMDFDPVVIVAASSLDIYDCQGDRCLFFFFCMFYY